MLVRLARVHHRWQVGRVLIVTTPRLPDWQTRLGAAIEVVRTAPFAWGPHDCCSFAANCVHACTGVDPLAAERGAYATAKEAAGRLATYGGVVGLGDALFGARKAPLLARVGDVGLAVIDGRDTLVVCNGTTWLGPGEHGLVALPFDAATAAWQK